MNEPGAGLHSTGSVGRYSAIVFNSVSVSSVRVSPAPADVLAQMRHGGRTGDEEDVRGALEQPGQRDGHRCGAETAGNRFECVGLQWSEAAEREVGHVGNALRGEGVDQVIVLPVGDVVEVLHAHNRRDGLCFDDLLGGDGADTEVLDQSLVLQLRKYGEWFGDRAGRRAV